MAVRPEESVEEVSYIEQSEHGARQTGANRQKHFLTFVPLRDNADFQAVEGGGFGQGFPYSHMGPVAFALDYSSLVFTFLGQRVTVTGRNLKSHYVEATAHRLDLIEQKATDPFLTAKTADEATLAANQLVVTGLKLETITE